MQELDGRKYFWRLTNENETHNDYQYKDGLNELPVNEKFNPSGSCEPGGLYFLGDTVLQWAYYQKYSWLRMVEIPDDARVYEDPYGDKYKADKLFLHPRVSFFPEGVLKIMKEDSRSLNYFRENQNHIALAQLLMNLAKSGADPMELQPILENFPEIPMGAKLALYIYVGDVKKVKYLVKIAPDKLVENIYKIDWLSDAIFTLPKSLQVGIIKILVARGSLPSLLNLYYSSPDDMAPYLERQLWKLMKLYSSPPYDKQTRYDGSLEVLFELSHFVRPFNVKPNTRQLSKRVLNKINKGSNGRLEYLLITWLLCSTSETEENFYLTAYNNLGKKNFSLEEVMIEALGNKAHVRQPDIDVSQMLRVIDLLGLKPTTLLVYGENIRTRRHKGVIPAWNRLVRKNLKENTKENQNHSSKKRQPTAAAR